MAVESCFTDTPVIANLETIRCNTGIRLRVPLMSVIGDLSTVGLVNSLPLVEAHLPAKLSVYPN